MTDIQYTNPCPVCDKPHATNQALCRTCYKAMSYTDRATFSRLSSVPEAAAQMIESLRNKKLVEKAKSIQSIVPTFVPREAIRAWGLLDEQRRRNPKNRNPKLIQEALRRYWLAANPEQRMTALESLPIELRSLADQIAGVKTRQSTTIHGSDSD